MGGVSGIVGDILRPSPGRLIATWRTVLAVVLVTAVMTTFRMPFLAIGPFLVFVLSQKNLFLSRVVAVLLVPMLTIACLVLYGVAAVSWDTPWLRIALWVAIFWGGFYLMHIVAEPRLLVGPLCIIAVVSYAFDEYPYPNLILSKLGWIWALVGVSVTSVFLTQWLTGVPTALEHVRREFQRLARLVEDICQARAAGKRPEEFDDEGLEDATELAEKLGKAHLISGSQSQNCLVVFESLQSVASLAVSPQPVNPPDPLWKKVASAVAGLRRQVLESAPAVPVEEKTESSTASEALEILVTTSRTLQEESAIPAAEAKKEGFIAADAFSNPAHGDFALRAMGATMACYLLMSLTSWDGIHTCMITCVVTALADRLEREHKQRLRIGGAIVGGLLGIFAVVYLVPLVDGIAGLLTILAAGTGIAAWVANGSRRISYAGWQIGLAFFMTLLQSPHAETKLDVIRDRWVGIILGIAAMQWAFTGFRQSVAVKRAPLKAHSH
jgi:multidrug resistance protein MdtO